MGLLLCGPCASIYRPYRVRRPQIRRVASPYRTVHFRDVYPYRFLIFGSHDSRLSFPSHVPAVPETWLLWAVAAALQAATKGTGLVLSASVVARAAKRSGEVEDAQGDDRTGEDVNGPVRGGGHDRAGERFNKDDNVGDGDDPGKDIKDVVILGSCEMTLGDLALMFHKDSGRGLSGGRKAMASPCSNGVKPGGGRNLDVLCRASAGPNAGDSPLDPENLSRYELMDFLAKKTMVLLERVHLADKTEGAAVEELEHLRVEGQTLVQELTNGRISLHQAEIKLLGLHSRIGTVLRFCHGQDQPGWYSSPVTLEMQMSTKLMLSMFLVKKNLCSCMDEGQMDYFQQGGKSEEDPSLAGLLRALIHNTTLIVDKLPDLLLLPSDGSPSVTLRELVSFSSLELHELQNRCHILQVEVGDGDVPDNVASGTLLGLHGRLRAILICVRECFYADRVVDGPQAVPVILGKILKGDLCFSMSQVEESVEKYNGTKYY